MHLYIHFPFCISKCDYCDFFSVPSICGIPDEYIQALLNEIQYRSRKTDGFSTVYIGGGTPSLLSEKQLDYFLKKLNEICRITENAEFTVEMNPESVSDGKLKICSENRVNRISMGIQSVNDDELKSVNRHCNSRKIYEALEMLESNWKGRLNLDAIAGLPCQTEASLTKTLDVIVNAHPEHVSLYSLMIEDGTRLFDSSVIENYDYDAADRLWLYGKNYLEKNGFLQYEVSNFSKKGFESIHNSSYWKQEDYIGCGAGACSSFYSYGDSKGLRVNNLNDIEKYISFWFDREKFTDSTDYEKMPCQTEELSLETEEYEWLMLGFRKNEGVNEKEYYRKFKALEPWKGNLFERLIESSVIKSKFFDKGLLLHENSSNGEKCFKLSAEGLLYLNQFLTEL